MKTSFLFMVSSALPWSLTSDCWHDVLHPTAGNRCLNLGDKTPSYMVPVPIGGFLQLITDLPPAEAPLPPLTESEVTESPLPLVSKIAPASSLTDGTSPGAKPPGNAQAKVTVCFSLSSLAVLAASLLLWGILSSQFPPKRETRIEKKNLKERVACLGFSLLFPPLYLD